MINEHIQITRVPVTMVTPTFLIPATAVIPYRVYRNHGITAQLSHFRSNYSGYRGITAVPITMSLSNLHLSESCPLRYGHPTPLKLVHIHIK